MSPAFLIAALLAVFGLGTLFVTPWVGGPLLLIALLVFVIGLVVGGTAAATDAGPVVEDRPVPSPHLPGPDGHETRSD
jgi:hypothetical protein